MSAQPVPRPPLPRQPAKVPNGSKRSYDVPRWRDEGRLGGKEFVRKATEESSGRQGIVKHLSDPPRRGERAVNKKRHARRQRFYDEALYMQRMNGTPGILPIWDIDDTHGATPHWYAMPRAEPLTDAFSETSTVVDVVTHITALARTLAALAEQHTYHRDIKPDNLLWHDGAPVLADFGIAAFAQPAGLTQQGEKLGPANFIAPEMRQAGGNHRGERADVYSLAKTLFVLAHPRRGPYPPEGTHRVDAEEYSLATLGSRNATLTLGHVLEAATQFRVHDRLTMADFHAELQAWLDSYASKADLFRPIGRRASFRIGWGPDLFDRQRRDEEATRAMMMPCIRRIAEALTGDTSAWSEGIDHDSGDRSLGDYAWTPNSEEGFIPDGGTIWLATHPHDGQRIVLQAVLNHDVCFLAEAQRSGSPWTLEQQWGHTPWHRPRMPRTNDQIQQLANEVVSWIHRTDSSLAPKGPEQSTLTT
ncbi:protein kinase [Streptomyces sp. DH1]|uniref:protein kinase domain-containing protein n=1 Tax=Streptomyces sp. DH1 TaxID=2857012 RepID=UPI001E605D6C|nr:protein kinase [Streptomyces sp. DH1]